MVKAILKVAMVLLSSVIVVCSAEECPTVTENSRRALETFIKRSYRLPMDETVTLTDSDGVDAACYRRLIFRSGISRPRLVLYLAPDGKHLVSGIMDLTVDPMVTKKQRQREYATKLAAGALLRYEVMDAPVTMVVFGDFQCPYCKRFADIVGELTAEERGKLERIYRQLPLSIHSWAMEAAEFSTCVALQDKVAFWKIHDFLFTHQREISKESFETRILDFITHETTIDPRRVITCVQQRGFDSTLRKDEELAGDLGITGTPSVFLNGGRVFVRSVEDLRSALKAATLEKRV